MNSRSIPIEEQSCKAAFENDGYVACHAFLNGKEVADLSSHLKAFIAAKGSTLGSAAFYEDKNDPTTLKQIQHLEQQDEMFAKMLHDSKFTALAASLLGSEVVGKNVQYFNKPPGVGQPTPPHQDGYYFMLKPCKAVTMWLALEAVDEQNGCVRYVKGSHKQGMRDHARTSTLGFSQGIADYPLEQDTDNEIAMPAQAGDLLAHHAMTIHRADGNQSASRTRQAMGLIYYAADACEDVEAHAAYQQRLREEMIAAGKL